MTSFEDLVQGTLPKMFYGEQSPRPAKHHRDRADDIPQPPPGPDSVASAGDPDDPLEKQAEDRRKARARSPLPDPKDKTKGRVMARVHISGRLKQLVDGEITVNDLDDEELMTGQFRDKSGALNGRSKLIPKVMHQEIMRRILQRGQEKIRSDYFGALDTVSEIMRDDLVDPQVRLRAANMIIERTAGKTPEKVELSVEVKKYEEVATAIMRELPEDIEEAELVDDDE